MTKHSEVKQRSMVIPHQPVKTDCTEGGRTHQSFRDECDINQIMAKYHKTGAMEQVNERAQVFGDFSGVDDYQTSLNRIIDADMAFMTLPSDVRDRMKNDPAELLRFLHDEDNREEAVSLGLVEAPAEPVVDQAGLGPEIKTDPRGSEGSGEPAPQVPDQPA